MGFTAVATVDDDDCDDVSEVISLPPKKVATSGSRGSKKAQRSGSNVYSVFSQKQLGEFKEAFHMMDEDKDGIISKSDLRATYNKVGSRPPDEDDLNEMINEGSGAMNFTTLLTLFADKMSGPSDDDDIVINAFKCFDKNGKIDSEGLRQQLITFGDKFTEDEIDNIFDNLDVDSRGQFETRQIISMLTGTDGEEEGQDGAGGYEEEAEGDVTFSL